jgi:hypothetical protein
LTNFPGKADEGGADRLGDGDGGTPDRARLLLAAFSDRHSSRLTRPIS